MSSNYTGNPTAAEAPSPAPGPGAVPIVVLPSDGDALNAASIAQLGKTLADNAAFANSGMRQSGSELVFYDDFLGNDFDHGLWLGNATPTISGDTANGGSGALTLTKNSTATDLETTQGMNIGTSLNFRYGYRIRVSSFGGSGSSVLFGLVQDPVAMFLGGGAANWCAMSYYPSIQGNSNWWLWNGNGDFVVSQPSQRDTGHAVTTTTYSDIEVTRTGGTIAILFNGTQIDSFSPTPFSLVGAAPFMAVTRATSGTTTALFDYVKLWLPSR